MLIWHEIICNWYWLSISWFLLEQKHYIFCGAHIMFCDFSALNGMLRQYLICCIVIVIATMGDMTCTIDLFSNVSNWFLLEHFLLSLCGDHINFFKFPLEHQLYCKRLNSFIEVLLTMPHVLLRTNIHFNGIIIWSLLEHFLCFLYGAMWISFEFLPYYGM